MKKTVAAIIIGLLYGVICLGQNVGVGTLDPSATFHIEGNTTKIIAVEDGFEDNALNPPFNAGVIDGSTDGSGVWAIIENVANTGTYAIKSPDVILAGETEIISFPVSIPANTQVNINLAKVHGAIQDQALIRVQVGNSIDTVSLSKSGVWHGASVSLPSTDPVSEVLIGITAITDLLSVVYIDDIVVSYTEDYSFKLQDGNEKLGRVLVSDDFGNATWQDKSELLVSSLINGTGDTLLLADNGAVTWGRGQASGINASSWGLWSEASADYATSWGWLSQSTDNHATSWGLQTLASADLATAWGSNSSATAESSTAWGKNTRSLASFSTAWGNRSIASGTGGTSWGDSTEARGYIATSWGFKTLAAESQSTAWGRSTQAMGANSTSWGINNNATQANATVWGNGNLSSNIESTAWGFGTEASGQQATSFGIGSVASSRSSLAFGEDTEASANMATAWGSNSLASGTNATSWGQGSLSSGSLSTAWGNNTQALSTSSTAFGSGSLATNTAATAWGSGTNASGNTATAWGQSTMATNIRSTAWGANTTASGSNATASGFNTIAAGNNSFSMGNFTKSNSFVELSLGNYNYAPIGSTNGWQSNDQLFSIGNGLSEATRSNALTVLKNGYLGVNKDVPEFALDLEATNSNKARFKSINGDIDLVIDGNSGNNSLEWQENGFFRASLGWDVTNQRAFFYQGGTNVFYIKNGRMGIKDVNPEYALELPNSTSNTVGRARANSWATYSDGRVKKNQSKLQYGLKEILLMTPKKYDHHTADFTEQGDLNIGEEMEATIGLIAQEVHEIIPEAVNKPMDPNQNLWSMDYEKLIPVLIKSIQELNERIVSLEKEVGECRKQKQLASTK